MKETPIIDEIKCTGCGECAYICPKDLIFIENKKAALNKNECMQECMLCSHCYAVCRFNAISFNDDLEKISFESFKYKEKILNSTDISPENFINAVRSRRSIRKYKNEKIDDELISDLLEFAVTAPSGSNRQEWKFTVLNGRDKVWDLAIEIKNFFAKINRLASNRLIRYLSVIFMGRTLINYYNGHYNTVDRAIKQSEAGIDLLFHGAPCLIIVHGSVNGSTPIEDAAYASYNICMLARFLNLGTCLIGFAVEALNRSSDLKAKLNIDKKDRIHSVIIIGRPDIEFKKHSLRKKYYVRFL
ncbi:MAG: nitroreductase family protein [Leptospirales bacterium]|nr:nitroreductase family protein [Leptospirales bacterium]MCL2156333.1 nitroreductase family protein [Leptospirales bacterium]